jgi:hypothetical protein
MSEPSGALEGGFWPARAALAAEGATVLRERDQAVGGIVPRALRRARHAVLLTGWCWRRGRGIVRTMRARLAPADSFAAPEGLTPGQLVRGLSRSTRARAVARLALLPLFDAADYLALNRDVVASGMSAGAHALFHGVSEERALFRPEKIARNLGLLAAAPTPAAGMPALSRALPEPSRPPPRIGVYVSSVGNVFMREIAEDLVATLRLGGAKADLFDETSDIGRRPSLCVFVAPHEFFVLGRGPSWVRDDVVARAVMLNTEQIQTKWFARALPLLLASRGVLDVCAQTADLLALTGVPCLPIGLAPLDGAGRLAAADRAHPLFRVLPLAARADPLASTPLARRPLDIAFFGTESPHREAWLARNAGFLADYDCFIHLRRIDRGPLSAGTADGALTRLARHVCGHSRISLNLHRDAYGYLEWHRIVRLGLAGGGVVVSEPCLPHPLLRPGVHYFEENARQIPDLLEWLLRSPDGKARADAVQANAAALLAGELGGGRAAGRVLAFLRDAALVAA